MELEGALSELLERSRGGKTSMWKTNVACNCFLFSLLIGHKSRALRLIILTAVRFAPSPPGLFFANLIGELANAMCGHSRFVR